MKAPTVRRGPYAGDQLSVDHIIPRAVWPELDNLIANLELMPLRMNSSKSDKIGARQRSKIIIAFQTGRARVAGSRERHSLASLLGKSTECRK